LLNDENVNDGTEKKRMKREVYSSYCHKFMNMESFTLMSIVLRQRQRVGKVIANCKQMTGEMSIGKGGETWKTIPARRL